MRKLIKNREEMEFLRAVYDREVDRFNALEREGRHQEQMEGFWEVSFEKTLFHHKSTGRSYEITNRGWCPYEPGLKFARRRMPAKPRLVRII